MEVVGSEIGQKMRSAIKAKLTELGCYVDDELPDYVMVMVANKRTRAQMEDDLQLFLGDNTELFVNWLHQVLKKLQEVTVSAPVKQTEREKSKERSKSKEKKSKDKKLKAKKKTDSIKKAKKKEKEKAKSSKKKEQKKLHKAKKKSRKHEVIRPNIPPLLMNIEKESEPSITDVFAGQILKNHGITIDTPKDEPRVVEQKLAEQEIKRTIIPIIDPATISQPEPSGSEITEKLDETEIPSTSAAPREDQLKEMQEIEVKIQGLKQKLAEQLDSMSDDDFLNIRTEAEELMNDFAEDVFQEISEQTPVTPLPATKPKSPTPILNIEPKVSEIPKEIPKPQEEVLPQIELNLPKRPVRERLGMRDGGQKISGEKLGQNTVNRTKSPERFTPERQPGSRPVKPTWARTAEPEKRKSLSDDGSDSSESDSNKVTSKSHAPEMRSFRGCASVVVVRPRPRAAPSSSLLLRAVADAHKSLLNIPPKPEAEPKIKRALVRPMRRCVDPQNIVIQVPADTSRDSVNTINLDDIKGESDNEEDVPVPMTSMSTDSEYLSTRGTEVRTSTRKDDTLIVETINIHHKPASEEKDTQFIVTMDGFNPNAFLAKKLLSEGLLEEDDDISKASDKVENIPEPKESDKIKEVIRDVCVKEKISQKIKEDTSHNVQKRLSDTSEESDTQVIINEEVKVAEKRKSVEEEEARIVKKRRASPIVFSVSKKEKEIPKEPEREKTRERTESASSDNHVIITTVPNTHKYDTVPPLSTAERKLVKCRSFPECRFGAACAYAHPKCKFAAACTRRGCIYSHSPAAAPAPTPAVLSSHVVPSVNFKSVPGSVPGMCKFYPQCANPTCHFFHPKPCRYGKACLNKLECNFYHSETAAASKWKYPV